MLYLEANSSNLFPVNIFNHTEYLEEVGWVWHTGSKINMKVGLWKLKLFINKLTTLVSMTSSLDTGVIIW